VTLADAETAEVYVLDVLGRRVRTLHRGPLPAGTHRMVLDGHGLAAGLYFVRLDAGDVHQTRGFSVVR
jgi:hypothetical protein